MCATPARMVTSGASGQLFSASQPMNFDPSAARASSRTSVPAGKKALLQVPEVLFDVKMQSMPAGDDVTRPDPVPPRASETLPVVAALSVVTVTVEERVTPPAVAMIVDDWLLVTVFVVTVKLALVAPAATVTDGGTVAAVVLLLLNETTKPPDGAAAVSVTVPVTGVPPTTVVWLSVNVERAASVVGGGALWTVHPERRAEEALADPSLTSMVQSAGALNDERSILKRPDPSLVPIATPSTVMVRLAMADPSTRRVVPLSSAFDTETAAAAWLGKNKERSRSVIRANPIVRR